MKEKIIEFLRDRPTGCTISEIGSILLGVNKNYRPVRLAIISLLKDGRIKKVGKLYELPRYTLTELPKP